MVDALRRVHRVLRSGGVLLDVHPTAINAAVEVGGQFAGLVDAGGGPARHAAADIALFAAVSEQLFVVDRAVEYDFFTCGDSIDELRDYIVDNWRDARIDEAVVERARRLAGATGEKPRIRERVRATAFKRVDPVHGR